MVNGLAERLAVAQDRPSAPAPVDLRAGVVDVIFARDVIAGVRPAGWRAHRPPPRRGAWPTCIGPVGLAETYSTLTLWPAPTVARPKASPCRDGSPQHLRPDRSGDRQVDEAGSGDVHTDHVVEGRKECGDPVGEIARLHPRVLRQHHGGVGGEVAMGRVTRRLDHDAVERCLRQDDAFRGESGHGRAHMLGEDCEDVHADDLTRSGRL